MTAINVFYQNHGKMRLNIVTEKEAVVSIMYTYKVAIFSVLCVVGLSITDLSSAVADDEFKGRAYTLSDVKGRYAFSFKGEIVGLGAVAAVGYIRSDGNGNIHEAQRTITVLGAATTESFSCTYTIQPNGKGSADCPLDVPAPGFPPVETFDYVLEDNGKSFRLVGTTPGVVVIGSGHR